MKAIEEMKEENFYKLHVFHIHISCSPFLSVHLLICGIADNVSGQFSSRIQPQVNQKGAHQEDI